MVTLITTELIEKYRNAKGRLILLDYDGTLVDFTSVPDTSIIPGHISDILAKLIGTPQTEVVIITGRNCKEIDKILGYLPVNIISEHGAMIKKNGIWENKVSDNTLWKDTIIPVLNQITLSCPESFIEEKTFSVAWHYRNVETQSGFTHSRELISTLEKIVHSFNLKILDGNKVVEIMPKEIGKGNAVKKLLEKNIFDFILSIGDDATDEEMFECLFNNVNAFTIKVGNGDTLARYKLAGINDVLSLLKNLTI
ncbi:MAG: trehalose-phosphatase [Bacteroidales bacterium]|nr:trehalose-phosphatase [Bacteroidales bacterium]